MRTRKNIQTLTCLAALITFSLPLSVWADETHWPLRLRGQSHLQEVNSISLQTLGEISLSERNDGSGSILLGRVVYSSTGSDAACYHPPTLDSIPEVRRVYELILANQKRILSEVSL